MDLPNFDFESKLLKKGFNIIAGVDEVGRGCFAGPIVAGCVAIGKDEMQGVMQNIPVVINDSKKMSPGQREKADKWIRENVHASGIGTASVSQINKLGIKKASEIAFRRAIKDCGERIDYLLIDAFYIPNVRGLRRKNQKAIVKGDTKSIAIAAASIIAKVYRDRLMSNLGTKRKYKKYGWAINKGYGTQMHRDMILKYGTTSYHRKQFVKTWLGRA